MGMQLPAAWQGMPGQPQIPAAAQQMAAAAQGAAMQQPGGMMAYPMQQFQVLFLFVVSGFYSPSNQ
jgi:nucleolysin TIA-1/TIAR